MSHRSVLDFGERVISPEMIIGKRVLEVGSMDVNGSLRPLIERLKPLSYLGVDIEAGDKVDRVLAASDLPHIGKFDFVLSNEMLEHVDDWRETVDNLKNATTDYLLITTRSLPFPYHGFPEDNWRYSIEDMQAIFADMDIIHLEDDPEFPGVFMLARKTTRTPIVLDFIQLEAAPEKPPWY